MIMSRSSRESFGKVWMEFRGQPKTAMGCLGITLGADSGARAATEAQMRSFDGAGHLSILAGRTRSKEGRKDNRGIDRVQRVNSADPTTLVTSAGLVANLEAAKADFWQPEPNQPTVPSLASVLPQPLQPQGDGFKAGND